MNRKSITVNPLPTVGILVLVLLVVALSACGASATTPPMTQVVKETVVVTAVVTSAPATVGTDLSKFQDGKPFVFLGTNRSHPVVKIMEAGFLQACADFKLQCELYGVEGNDIPGSVTMGEKAVALPASGILDTIYDKAQYAPALDAIKANIPVVNGHFPMTTDVLPGLSGWVAPDNVGYGVASADMMAQAINCKGPVAVTESGPSDAESAVGKAFSDELVKVCPGITVLDPVMEGTDLPKEIAAVAAIMQAHPDLTGAFSTTGGGIQAWTSAAKDAGKAPGAVKIIGMDYSAQNLDLVKSGEALALVAQPLYAEMYQGVVLLLEIRMGMPVPYANTLPAPLVTKDGVDQYYQINDLAAKVKLP